jgi:hypothetical protein
MGADQTGDRGLRLPAMHENVHVAEADGFTFEGKELIGHLSQKAGQFECHP